MDLIQLLDDTLVLLRNRPQSSGLDHRQGLWHSGAFAAIDADRIKQVFGTCWKTLFGLWMARATITVSVQGVGDFLRIGIQDTGRGVPPHLTERFLSRSNRN